MDAKALAMGGGLGDSMAFRESISCGNGGRVPKRRCFGAKVVGGCGWVQWQGLIPRAAYTATPWGNVGGLDAV